MCDAQVISLKASISIKSCFMFRMCRAVILPHTCQALETSVFLEQAVGSSANQQHCLRCTLTDESTFSTAMNVLLVTNQAAAELDKMMPKINRIKITSECRGAGGVLQL